MSGRPRKKLCSYEGPLTHLLQVKGANSTPSTLWSLGLGQEGSTWASWSRFCLPEQPSAWQPRESVCLGPESSPSCSHGGQCWAGRAASPTVECPSLSSPKRDQGLQIYLEVSVERLPWAWRGGPAECADRASCSGIRILQAGESAR